MSTASTTKTISYIGIVTVHVADQDAALRFYTETLGLEKRSDAEMPNMGGMRWVTVAPAGSTTEITLVSAFPDGGAPMGSNTGVVFETDDIDAAYRELSGRGVSFTGEPTKEPFGGWVEFTDPDGNRFGLHSNQVGG